MTITATYSPEDNKLRLYSSTRLDAETFESIMALGFRWAPKQELFVALRWTPQREDICTELAGEIEAEEMTLAERAAMKAERLEELAEKRDRQANAYASRAEELAERFYMGQPILVGHHSERSARKDQERMHGAMTKANELHKASNYWLGQIAGVEHFANMKNRDRTRANRIKKLLADLRELQRGINRAHRALAVWETVTTPEAIIHTLGNSDSRELFANYGEWGEARDDATKAEGIRAACIARAQNAATGPNRARWIAHTLNRLGFERSMLGDVARYAGDLSPAILQTFARTHGAEKPTARQVAPDRWQLETPQPLPLHMADGEALELDADGWRDMMQELGYEVPQKAKASPRRGSTAPLINPTLPQAMALQAAWNRRAEAAKGQSWNPDKSAGNVKAMGKAIYSAHSKGEYARFQTIEIDARGAPISWKWERMERVRTGEPVARIRIVTNPSELYGVRSIIHLSDAPGKALPVDLDDAPRQLELVA
jgi:hypothetical protein